MIRASLCGRRSFSGTGKIIGWLAQVRSDPKETLSLLMLCTSSNCQRPFSYHMKMEDFKYSHVFSCFLMKTKLA